jgi:hypothetical protein
MDENARFSIVAVLVLSLGIGVNTAVFTDVDAVLLSPLGSCRSCSHRLVPIGRPMKATRGLCRVAGCQGH